MDLLFGPNRSNWEQCTVLLFLGGFFYFFILFLDFLYLDGSRKISDIILDIIGEFYREKIEDILRFSSGERKRTKKIIIRRNFYLFFMISFLFFMDFISNSLSSMEE
jgi:hypothetical protein